MVLTMMKVIWRELRKVRVDSETVYDSEDNVVMVGQYLWENLQAYRVVDDLLRSQFRQHPEVAPHITLYLFNHWSPRVEVVYLKHKVQFQPKTIIQMEKTCKELRLIVYSMNNKEN